tara:strand:- start:1929 stop:2876 length:948 start_codon:yes stop_codon:yes gene_type:complete
MNNNVDSQKAYPASQTQRTLIASTRVWKNLRLLKALALMIVVAFNVNAATADEATRLISTDASATELLFSLGLDKDLIAVDVTSQLPEDYKSLPSIGYHRLLSAEGLLSLSPTAVIGSEFMGPPQVIDTLLRAGVTVVRLPSAKTGQQLRSNISSLAEALGQSSRGQQLTRKIDSDLAELSTRQLHGDKIAFLLRVAGGLRLAGSDTTGAALIKLLGGRNAANFSNYQTVSTESLMAMQADIILLAGKQQDAAVANLIGEHPVLRHSAAWQQSKILAIDSNSIVAGISVAAISEALRLSKQLSPQPPIIKQAAVQ